VIEGGDAWCVPRQTLSKEEEKEGEKGRKGEGGGREAASTRGPSSVREGKELEAGLKKKS
jgi:hypothetical protein